MGVDQSGAPTTISTIEDAKKKPKILLPYIKTESLNERFKNIPGDLKFFVL